MARASEPACTAALRRGIERLLALSDEGSWAAHSAAMPAVEADLPAHSATAATAAVLALEAGCVGPVQEVNLPPVKPPIFNELLTMALARSAACVDEELLGLSAFASHVGDAAATKHAFQIVAKAHALVDALAGLATALKAGGSEAQLIQHLAAVCSDTQGILRVAFVVSKPTPETTADAAKHHRLCTQAAARGCNGTSPRSHPSVAAVAAAAAAYHRATFLVATAKQLRCASRAGSDDEPNVPAQWANCLEARVLCQSALSALNVAFPTLVGGLGGRSTSSLTLTGVAGPADVEALCLRIAKGVVQPLLEATFECATEQKTTVTRDNDLIYFARLPTTPSDIRAVRTPFPPPPPPSAPGAAPQAVAPTIDGAVKAAAAAAQALVASPESENGLHAWASALRASLPSQEVLSTAATLQVVRAAALRRARVAVGATAESVDDNTSRFDAGVPAVIAVAFRYGSLAKWISQSAQDVQQLTERARFACQHLSRSRIAVKRSDREAAGRMPPVSNAANDLSAELGRLGSDQSIRQLLELNASALIALEPSMGAAVGDVWTLAYAAFHEAHQGIAKLGATCVGNGGAAVAGATARRVVADTCLAWARLSASTTLVEQQKQAPPPKVLQRRYGRLDQRVQEVSESLDAFRAKVDGLVAEWTSETAELERATAAGPIAAPAEGAPNLSRRRVRVEDPNPWSMPPPEPISRRGPRGEAGVPTAKVSSKLNALLDSDDNDDDA